ncbi:hypothetical protein [Flammeovirga kamogawensis]|uniref:Lipoprotein n=1 Tax=Flammeovirga kamogawensis TaxID=373891 RepID=A0ABX8H0J5_9BACT|nr:hypothetical protein [Flammeovirga kamogawensis]MBB6462257.1 hypothetical protein [Flammeovirga kamogawensis]QWG09345.1 hypothetical protein KM029_22325 [Flammeovirga kamogawensis]TRX64867.1 hypothetical protein EO216_20235 [Flammeovirga kamogawensis]
MRNYFLLGLLISLFFSCSPMNEAMLNGDISPNTKGANGHLPFNQLDFIKSEFQKVYSYSQFDSNTLLFDQATMEIQGAERVIFVPLKKNDLEYPQFLRLNQNYNDTNYTFNLVIMQYKYQDAMLLSTYNFKESLQTFHGTIAVLDLMDPLQKTVNYHRFIRGKEVTKRERFHGTTSFSHSCTDGQCGDGGGTTPNDFRGLGTNGGIRQLGGVTIKSGSYPNSNNLGGFGKGLTNSPNHFGNGNQGSISGGDGSGSTTRGYKVKSRAEAERFAKTKFKSSIQNRIQQQGPKKYIGTATRSNPLITITYEVYKENGKWNVKESVTGFVFANKYKISSVRSESNGNETTLKVTGIMSLGFNVMNSNLSISRRDVTEIVIDNKKNRIKKIID